MNGKFKEVKINRINKVLNYIIKSNYINNKCIYIASSIYQDKQYINKLQDEYAINIVINRPSNKLLSFLPIPTTRDVLVKIYKKEEIISIFHKLDEHNPIELYSFNKNIEDNFIENYAFNNISIVEKILFKDEEYLIYGVDFDNEEALYTNIMEYTSFGKNIPNEVTWYI